VNSTPLQNAGTWSEVDVTSQVSGNGVQSLGLDITSSTAVSYASREASSNHPELVVEYEDGPPPPPDGEAPTVPLITSGVATGANGAHLEWDPATDNVGVVGYTVYRDGVSLGTVPATTTSFDDSGLTAATTYTYTVDAFDAADNHSAQSLGRAVTTDAASTVQTATFGAAADAYVNEGSPNANYGAVTTIRADGSPLFNSYLRFDVSGLSGTVQKATLRVFNNSTSSVGHRARSVADNSWSESAITFANAPALGPVVASTTGSQAAGTWSEFDVTSQVAGNGTVGLALDTTSSTARAWPSREGAANQPELVVEYSATAPSPDTQAPSVPVITTGTATPPDGAHLEWVASTDNVGVDGYTVYRDGVAVATLPADATTFDDTGLGPGTYQYTVDAFDAASNRSLQSAAAGITLDAVTVATFSPTADAYVTADASGSNFGSSSTLRADGDPTVRSYLRFLNDRVSPIERATLRVYNNSTSSARHRALAVTDNSWSESALTFANAPTPGAVISSSDQQAAGTYSEFDVTSQVVPGDVSFAVDTTSPTARSWPSREAAANQPQLVLVVEEND
jgi:chitodextrinase